ncbi:modular serine protease [Anoplophora glabripennis]|nr:modular serine protease [Anoplophora glabripennis]
MRNVLLSRFLLNFYVILSVSGFFGITVGFSAVRNESIQLIRTPRQAGKCEGFKCTTTGECLPDDKRCDGKVDCKDGSDEFNDCKEDVQCPGYVFTCDYGACVDADKKCDGKKDCRDNSDEANCVLSNNVEKVSSNCKSDQFECKSGQCISQDAKCNGKPDCEDRSDETKETCLNMQCPGFTFKCDYGACVDGFAKCNNVKDCVDNSDEENCDETPVVPTPIPTTIPDIPSTGTGGCVLPEHPDFGQWSLLASNIVKNPSETVASSTALQFGCNDGYKLSSESSYIICVGNQWNAPPPTCLKKCRALYTTKFTTIRCFDTRRIEIKCDEATDGTSATFQCAPYYEPSDRNPVKRFCYGGTWNYPEPVCQPVCGEKKVSAQPLIVNGQTVEKGDYPWVTAVFQKVGGSYINSCGGSMLTQKIILTAAHCVTNQKAQKLPNEEILVGVGKYYNKYKDPRDTQAQYSKVDKIEIPDKYRGDSQRYALDIAILVTKEVLLLSKVVQPVCYQNLRNLHLDPTLHGVITGWGYTIASGEPSDELKEIDVPYKPDSECYKELPPDWSDKYFTDDKMCAGHYNKSIAVCRGDSGGGLVFQHDKRYFVHGVVSIGRSTMDACDVQVSSLYTKVSSHYEWMEQKIAENSFW